MTAFEFSVGFCHHKVCAIPGKYDAIIVRLLLKAQADTLRLVIRDGHSNTQNLKQQ